MKLDMARLAIYCIFMRQNKLHHLAMEHRTTAILYIISAIKGFQELECE